MVHGDLYCEEVAGSIKLGATGGSGRIVFAGEFDQEFYPRVDQTINVYAMEVNKPTRRVLVDGKLPIYDRIIFTKGIIETVSSGYVLIRDGATVLTVSDSSHVEGIVEKRGDDAFTFPIGRNGVYRPLSITAPSSASDEFQANYYQSNSDSIHGHDDADASLDYMSTNEYWTLTREAGTSTPKVTLSWDTLTSCVFPSPISRIHIAGWDGSNWDDLGNGGTTGTLDVGTVITTSAVSDFNMFTLEHDGELSCYDFELTWSTDTVVVDSLFDYFISSSNLPSGYTTALSLEGGGPTSLPGYFYDLLHIDTLTTTVHFSDTVGTFEAVIYIVNHYGYKVDSISYSIPYLRSGGEFVCECEEVECDHIYNGNFEHFESFPSGYAQVSTKVDCWNKGFVYQGTQDEDCAPIEWDVCTDMDGDADFFHDEATNPFVDIPLNSLTSIAINDLNLTTTEDSYVGIVAYYPVWGSPGGMEYLMQQLAEPLIQGRSYTIKFYLQLSNRSYRTITPHVLLTDATVCQEYISPIEIPPHGQFLSAPDPDLGSGYLFDFDEWHVVEIEFVATDDWSDITIGFFTQEPILGIDIWSTIDPDLLYYPNGTIVQQTYWFIDEVSLIPNDPVITQGGAITVCTDDLPLTLNASGSGDGDNIYTWSSTPPDGSLSGQENEAEIVVSPSVNTTYTVTIDGPFGCEKTASIAVTVGTAPSGVITTDAADACDGEDVQNYAISWGETDPGDAITWTAPTGVTFLGQGTDEITEVDWGDTEHIGGIICVSVYDDSEGCTGTACIEVEPCCSTKGLVAVDDETYAPDGNGDDVLGSSAPYVVVDNYTLTGETFVISGTFTVDGDLTLDGCNIYMTNGGTIVVNPNATLTITNSTHIHACSKLWNGILVWNDAEIIVDEQSLIEDAHFAIIFAQGSAYTIDEAVFNKNYVHLYFYQLDGGAAPSGTVTNSYFLCQTTETVAFPPILNDSPNYGYHSWTSIWKSNFSRNYKCCRLLVDRRGCNRWKPV